MNGYSRINSETTRKFIAHIIQLDAIAAADPFQSFTPCYLEASRRGIQQTIVSDIDRFWDMPGSNGVAASEACPNCRTRNADDLEIIDGYNCGAYVRCSCGHEYTIEDQFSN